MAFSSTGSILPFFLQQPGVRIRPPNGKSHWAFFVAGKTRLAEAAERDAARGKGGGRKINATHPIMERGSGGDN